MAQYIIYSGGANGYKLYAAHPDFPEEYREQVEALYVRQRIATGADALLHCYRFAPLKDRYIFSVIYKGCVCEGERRPFFATVNWLFTAQEADEFLGRNVQTGFARLAQQSDEILLANGYTFPKTQPIVSDYRESITVNAQKALLTAAYNAMRASTDEDKTLSAQVFLGCAQGESLFSPIFWLLNVIPPRMRRHISFHIGAVSAEETQGVSVAVTYDEMFAKMSATGDYVGTMAVRKIIVLKDTFSAFSEPVSVAEAFLLLSPEQKCRLNTLFLRSDKIDGFWKYIMAVYAKNTDMTKGAALAILIGERGFAEAINVGAFSDQELLEMYREKQKLSAHTALLALLEERVQPLLPSVQEASASETEDRFDQEDQKKHKKEEDEEDRKKEHGEREQDRDNEEKKAQHHKKSKKHKASFKKFFKRCGKLIGRLFRVLLPFLCIVASWLLPVIVGVGMFFLGVLAVKLLPSQFLWLAYGIQIAVLMLMAMPLGYFAISLTQHQIARWKEARKERRKEEEDAK